MYLVDTLATIDVCCAFLSRASLTFSVFKNDTFFVSCCVNNRMFGFKCIVCAWPWAWMILYYLQELEGKRERERACNVEILYL